MFKLTLTAANPTNKATKRTMDSIIPISNAAQLMTLGEPPKAPHLSDKKIQPIEGIQNLRQKSLAASLEKSNEVKEAYTNFVGKTFFSQLVKSMRTMNDKPAYFHGGQAEEIFRSQLDELIVDHMSDSTASTIADPMFARQFPEHAAVIKQAQEANEKNDTPETGVNSTSTLSTLEQLRRR